jgi:hypothetical protein
MGQIGVLAQIVNPTQTMYPRRLGWMYRRYRINDPSHAIQVDPDIEAKMMRDGDIAFYFNFRKMLVAGTGFHVDPGTKKADEKQVARASLEQDLISCIDRFDESRRNLAYADMSGARAAQIQGEIVKANFGDGVVRTWAVPTRLVDMAKEDFRFVNKGHSSGFDVDIEQQVWSINRDGYDELKNTQDYVLHRVGNSEEYAMYGHGLREALAYIWYAKSHLFQTMSETSDRYGQGWLKIKVESGGIATDSAFPNSEVYRSAVERGEAMRQGGVLVLADGEEAELLESKGTGFNMVLQHYNMLQEMTSRLILGAVLPTGGGDQGAGSLSRAETEKSSTQIIVGTSRRALEDSLSLHLMNWIAHYNRANFEEMGLASVPSGRIRIDDDDTLSAKESMEFYGQLLEKNVAMYADEFYEGIGVKRPEGVPDIINDPSLAAPPEPDYAPGSPEMNEEKEPEDG